MKTEREREKDVKKRKTHKTQIHPNTTENEEEEVEKIHITLRCELVLFAYRVLLQKEHEPIKWQLM